MQSIYIEIYIYLYMILRISPSFCVFLAAIYTHSLTRSMAAKQATHSRRSVWRRAMAGVHGVGFNWGWGMISLHCCVCWERPEVVPRTSIRNRLVCVSAALASDSSCIQSFLYSPTTKNCCIFILVALFCAQWVCVCVIRCGLVVWEPIIISVSNCFRRREVYTINVCWWSVTISSKRNQPKCVS